MRPFELLLNSYQAATQGWLGYGVEAGLDLFRKLAALELITFGFLVALKSRGGAAAVLPDLTWKLFLIALFLTGLLVYPLWIPTITPSFAANGFMSATSSFTRATAAGQTRIISSIALAGDLAMVSCIRQSACVS